MFVHTVYFWLKNDLGQAEMEEFVQRLNALATIESVERCYIGRPASTRREVIDHSYSYALVVLFPDERAHDAYQRHPTHDEFRDACASFWTRVQVYDSVGLELFTK
jgi:hypothetical protein